MNNLKATSTGLFTLAPTVINGFSPKVILTGQRVTLNGSHFSPVAQHNKVFIGGLQAEVASASPTELVVTVPLQHRGVYPGRDVTISVEVLNDEKQFPDRLTINDKWFRIPDFPGRGSINMHSFTVGNHAYVGLEATREFWRFDGATKQWTRLRDFPGAGRIYGTGFYIDGSIYFGTGLAWNGTQFGNNLADFWQYHIATDTWIQKNNFPGRIRMAASGFSIDGIGYLTSGRYEQIGIYNHPYSDCWAYDAGTDTWTQIESYADDAIDLEGLANAATTVVGKITYFGLGWNFVVDQGNLEKVYAFDPSAEIPWRRIASFPVPVYSGNSIAFTLDDMPYFKTGNTGFYRYDARGDRWEHIPTSILTDVSAGIGFAVSGKAYVGLGATKAIWEYDPTR